MGFLNFPPPTDNSSAINLPRESSAPAAVTTKPIAERTAANFTASMGLKYEPALDGLRALSALAVVLFHCSVPYSGGGGRGVDVFFVLSGYLITRILLRQSPIDLKRFWVGRVRRLLPALLIVVAVAAVAAPFYGNAEGSTPDEVVYALTYTMNLALANGHRFAPLTHTWTLATEMQFYLLWPFMVPVLRRAKHPAAILLLAWVAVTALRLGHDSTFARFSPFTRCSGLLIGAAINFLPSPTNPIGAHGLGLIGVSAVNGWDWWDIVAPTLTEIGAALLIANVISRSSGWKNILSNKILVRLGVVSYGIYLWHNPLVTLANRYGWIVRLPFVLPTTILLALLSYDLVEKRFRTGQRERGALLLEAPE